jgi:hypothetical protein
MEVLLGEGRKIKFGGPVVKLRNSFVVFLALAFRLNLEISG